MTVVNLNTYTLPKPSLQRFLAVPALVRDVAGLHS